MCNASNAQPIRPGVKAPAVHDDPLGCALFQGTPSGDSEQTTTLTRYFHPSSAQLEHSTANRASKLTPEHGASTTRAATTVASSFTEAPDRGKQCPELSQRASTAKHEQGNNNSTPTHEEGGSSAMIPITSITAPETSYRHFAAVVRSRCSQQPPRPRLTTVVTEAAGDNIRRARNFPT